MAWKNAPLHMLLAKFRRGVIAMISCADHFEDVANDETLEFALNDPRYSDRMLQIKIFDDEYEDERPIIRVEEIYINSLLLASKSQFFLKLFSNGMKESYPNCPVTIRIYASEEDNLMEILHFMYGRKLSSTTMKSLPALLGLLKLADKFQVVSCMEQCVQSLLGLPMTRKSALLYLDIPVRREYQPLIDEAKRFLVSRYKDLTKSHNVLCNMTIAGMEAILSSDDVRAPSEDYVYKIVLNWAKIQYPRLEDRREVLRSCITRLVRFPYLTCAKLREVLTCEDLDHEFSRDVVEEALFFKADPQQCDRLFNTLPVESFVERVHKKTIFFYDLNLAACKILKSGDSLHSQKFYSGEQPFSLQIKRFNGCPSEPDSLGLLLISKGKYLTIVNFVFAAKQKPEMDFQELNPLMAILKENGARGYSNPFDMPWDAFIADDSPYFIDGVFHLRVEISIKPQTRPIW